jgi:hypothetical protein
MRIIAFVRSALRRLPRSAEVLSELSRLVESDSNRQKIEQGLETILKRSLIRPVVVIPMEARLTEEEQASPDDGAWNTDRRAIVAWLDSRRFAPTEEAKLTTLFGGARKAPDRIAALAPVFSSSGSTLAMVVIGRRRFVPLAEAEQSLIAAAVGMAMLLLEQVRLRGTLDVAAAADAAKRLVDNHQRHVRQQYPLHQRNLN